MSQNDARMDRRGFLNKSATVLAAGAAFSSTALSYDRILGANDRISLGHIGFGSRGRDLGQIASILHKTHNVEMTAVCDLWTVNRDRAVGFLDPGHVADREDLGVAGERKLGPDRDTAGGVELGLTAAARAVAKMGAMP